MRQKRSLGQVFLRSQKYVRKIIESLDIESKAVVEIGPGRGEITQLLSSVAKRVYAIELDRRLIPYLENKFSQFGNVEIIAADILQFPISKLGRGLVVFGNVPYYLSSRLIEYLIKQRGYVKRAYFTFQKEFAARLLANPGDRQYGFISCHLQYYAQAKKRFDIPAGAFSPQPKVKSTFISLEFYQKPPLAVDDEEDLFKLIKEYFNQPRKKVVGTLRPGQLSLKKYIAIVNSDKLSKKAP